MALPFSTRISPIYTLTAGQVGPFTQGWPLYAAADLRVLRLRAGVKAVLVLDADYSVTGAGSASTGFSLLLLAGALEGDKLIMIGARNVARITTYTAERSVTPTFLNLDQNMTFAQLQEIQREVERAFKTSLFDPDAFDMEGLRLTNVGAAVNPSDAVNLGQIQTSLDDATAAATALAEAARDDAQDAKTAALAAEATAIAAAGAASGAQSAADTAKNDAVTAKNDAQAAAATAVAASSFQQSGTGAISRSVQNYLRENALRITDFGAIGDDSTDNTAAIAAAVLAAETQGKSLYIPEGIFRHAGIVVSKCIPILGANDYQSILRYTGNGTAVKIAPPSNGLANRGQLLQDFGIDHTGSGLIGLQVQLPASASGFYTTFRWHRVRVTDFATRSAWLDNSVNNTDGFFIGQIEKCFFDNGFAGTNIGDSIKFEDNRIGGTAPLQLSGVSGARAFKATNNNITTSGGVQISGLHGSRWDINQIEIFNTVNYSGAGLGQVTFNNCSETTFVRNTVSKIGTGTKPTYAILIDGSFDNAFIDECELDKGSVAHIGSGAGTGSFFIGAKNSYDVAAVFDISGAVNAIVEASFNRNYLTAWTSIARSSAAGTIGATSGSITSAAGTLRYKIIGKTAFFSVDVTVTTNGTGAGALTVALPFTIASACAFIGKEVAVSGFPVYSTAGPSSTSLFLFKLLDNTYPGANGRQFYVSGSCEIQ